MYTLSHTHRWRGERCDALSVLGKERARAGNMHKTSRTATPANFWLSQPDPSQGMGRRSGRVTSRVKERMGNQQSELASERAKWRPIEQIGVRESGWALG